MRPLLWAIFCLAVNMHHLHTASVVRHFKVLTVLKVLAPLEMLMTQALLEVLMPRVLLEVLSCATQDACDVVAVRGLFLPVMSKMHAAPALL